MQFLLYNPTDDSNHFFDQFLEAHDVRLAGPEEYYTSPDARGFQVLMVQEVPTVAQESKWTENTGPSFLSKMQTVYWMVHWVCPKIKLFEIIRAGPPDQILYLYLSNFQVFMDQKVPTMDLDCSGSRMSGPSLRCEQGVTETIWSGANR